MLLLRTVSEQNRINDGERVPHAELCARLASYATLELGFDNEGYRGKEISRVFKCRW